MQAHGLLPPDQTPSPHSAVQVATAQKQRLSIERGTASKHMIVCDDDDREGSNRRQTLARGDKKQDFEFCGKIGLLQEAKFDHKSDLCYTMEKQ